MKKQSNLNCAEKTAFPPYRIISDAECELRTNLKRKQRLRMEAVGEFPKRIPLADRLTGYLELEIDEWIRAKVEQREEAISLRKSPNPLARDNKKALSKFGRSSS